MYKYLTEKLEENTNGATVGRITLLAFDSMIEDYNSDIIDDFQDSFSISEMCKFFKFRDEKDVHAMFNEHIEEKQLAWFLSSECNKSGFLSEIHIPVLSNISLNENKDGISACSYSHGHYQTEWVYADTIGELSDKIIEVCRIRTDKLIKKELKK